MSFLFLWQVMLVAPLTAASGGVGFADYARFLFPHMPPFTHTTVAMLVCIAVTFLLYRDIRAIGRISVVLWFGLMLALGIVIWGLPPNAFRFSTQFFVGLGAATLISTYDFSGYFNICLIGGEVEKPASTIPRAVLMVLPPVWCKSI
jgi:amino acid transporter